MQRQQVPHFIQTIWQLVSDPNNSPTIGWNNQGTAFLVTNPDSFTTDILPQHFSHSNLSSFTRQLNMYNFHKRTTMENQLQFRHKLFRRSAKELLPAIKRKPSQADLHHAEQLLKQFLSSQSQQPTLTPNQDSNHPTLEHSSNKQTTTILPTLKPKLIKNIIVVSPEPISN